MITGERQTKHLIAGAVSGAVATGVTAPLELVKTVLQGGAVQRNVGSLTILKEQFKLGGTKACFRGLCPSLLAIIPHSGAYFWTYELFKKAVCKSENFQNLCGNRYVELGSSAASAMVAGAFANVITNPIWVVKTKMTANALEYPNVHQTMRKIMSAEGYKGFFCGVGASVLGVSHVMVQFPVYESVKKSMGKKWDNLEYGPCGCNPHAESTQTILFASVTSKFAASVTTYPLEVIRTQMQKEGEIGMKAGIERCMKIYAKDKLGGFYRGFNASMMKSVPATAITLLMYEEIIKKIEASS